MASFDGNGLVIDRLADIKTQIEDELRAAYGNGINLEDSSPWGIIVGIVSERYSLLWELLEAVYQASFPQTSFGVYLEELVAFNGMIREPATYSTVELTFTRSNPSDQGPVTIPAGTQVSSPDDSTTIWTTEIEAQIADGETTTTTEAIANNVGPIGALAGTLTVLITGVTNILGVDNLSDATEGSAEETDAELKNRRTTQLGRAGTSTESGIRSALTLLDEVRTATIVVNDEDYAVGNLPPHSFEAFVSPESAYNLGQQSNLTWSEDMVTGNSVALTIDGNPMIGSPVAFSGTHEATMQAIAVVVQDQSEIATAEYDATNNRINASSQNETGVTMAAVITGGAVQPTVQFNETAPADGTLDVIAQTLWDSKSAGIETYGIYTGVAVDTSGENQFMNFSGIEETRLYVRFTLTIEDGVYSPTVAEPAIQQALVNYAQVYLLPGVDVLNYKLLCAASDVGAAGILGIVCENSINGTDFEAVNRDIAVSTFASIESSDVTFVYT